ncbi:hypothetical protein ACLQ18_29405 [Streptomyces sp. DT193]|uniref:hypothetical protein n=1 Tax=Streptomyces sp. DT193 TaxID=3393418 RepID=UPI003CE9D2EA
MSLTRPLPHAGQPRTTRDTPGAAGEAADAAQCAARLEALLGDFRDPRNPYGRQTLWATGRADLPAPPAGLPGVVDVPAADRLARALRPLFRRDLALAHAWSISPLLSTPVPHPAAALLGPAALLAVAGGVLRSTTRIVDGLGRHEPAARQWQPVLASVFADLLACESLTAVALRSCPGPDTAGPTTPEREAERPLAAVVGYLVPELVGELLGDLELVLTECGFNGDTLERRTLARILRDRGFARTDWTAAGAARTRIVQGLNAAGGSWPDDGPERAALFRITEAAPAGASGTDGLRFVAATLADAAGRPVDEGGTGALARVARRLLVEQRALRAACAATAVHDPADPAARALADRQAWLTLAAATLGVRETAAGGPETTAGGRESTAGESGRLPRRSCGESAVRKTVAGERTAFLGGTDWALLALGRIIARLGLPVPDRSPDPQPGVWEELARRAANGVDCDLYATRLP